MLSPWGHESHVCFRYPCSCTPNVDFLCPHRPALLQASCSNGASDWYPSGFFRTDLCVTWPNPIVSDQAVWISISPCSHLTSSTTPPSANTQHLLTLWLRYSQYRRARPNTRINWINHLHPSRPMSNRRSWLTTACCVASSGGTNPTSTINLAYTARCQI